MAKTTKTIVAALYARVSTDKQDLLNQLTPLRAMAVRHGWEVREFTDEMSGSRSDRPGLKLLMAAVVKREIDVVMAVRLDRLGRSVSDLLANWEIMESNTVRIIITDQMVDTSTPAGRLMRTILGAVGEFERDLIVERIRSGIAEKRRRGEYRGGRPQIPSLTRDRVLALAEAHPGASLRQLKDMVPPYRTASDRERRVSISTIATILSNKPPVSSPRSLEVESGV